MYHPFPEDRNKAIQRAQELLGSNPLFLDTETAGLSNDDEICEIAIIDAAGDVILNSLVKPTKPIPPSTSEIHGITNEMVAQAPTFADLLPELERLLRNREVLVYNAGFDEGMLARSAQVNHCEFTNENLAWWWSFPLKNIVTGDVPKYKSYWHCAMKLYAKFWGDYNDWHGDYRWVRLSLAARQCGIELPAGIHRAHADAELTRRIVLYIAEQEIQLIGGES